MHQTRFALAALVTMSLVTPLGGAPRARYDYYLTGNGADHAAGETTFGLGLMGGGTDVDALFTWMSDRAGGGDFVVIRASGADGYNQYVFDLGEFDSVETFVLQNRAASSDPFVLQTIRNAEALFIAGGRPIGLRNAVEGHAHRGRDPRTRREGHSCGGHERRHGDPERIHLRGAE
jgi:cyanophycinase